MGRKGLQTLTYRESTVPLELWRHPFVQGSCREGQDSDVESQRILPIGKNQTRMSPETHKDLKRVTRIYRF